MEREEVPKAELEKICWKDEHFIETVSIYIHSNRRLRNLTLGVIIVWAYLGECDGVLYEEPFLRSNVDLWAS